MAVEDQILVQIVDGNGTTTGHKEKMAAHRRPGSLHRAFSIFLFDSAGKMLLQRRAGSKYHWPNVLSNSCCGHPLPGEAAEDGARRRVWDELGVVANLLVPAGVTTYRFFDDDTDLVEHEYNHVYVGTIRSDVLTPNSDEVSEVKYVTASDLQALRASENFSAWFDVVLAQARTRLGEVTSEAF